METNKTKEKNLRIDFDWKIFDALVQFKVPLQFIADYMKISKDTIERRIRDSHDMTYKEYQLTKQNYISYKLQQKLISKALDGKGDKACLIFALKNFSNFSDRMEQNVSVGSTPYEDMTVEEIMKKREALKERNNNTIDKKNLND